jgi:hypothetical protein
MHASLFDPDPLVADQCSVVVFGFIGVDVRVLHPGDRHQGVVPDELADPRPLHTRKV